MGMSGEKECVPYFDEPVVRCVWDVGAILGEGALWSDRAQCLWFVDIEGAWLYRWVPATGDRLQVKAPDRIGFVAEASYGRLVTGLAKELSIFNTSDLSFAADRRVESDRPSNRLNDGTVGPDGQLWFGSLHDPHSEKTGAWYRWTGAGDPQLIDDGYVITNGPAFSPDGRAMYFCDTIQGKILKRQIDRSAVLGPLETFANIEAGAGFPDGVAVDEAGHVWVALYAGWAVRCYDPSGKIVAIIEMPCANPTKPAFGDKDRKTLYITSARAGLDASELTSQPLAGGLFAVRTDTAGLPAGIFGLAEDGKDE